MPRAVSEAERAQREEELARNGFTILERLISPEEVQALAQALQPLQEAAPYGANDFTGFRTRRVFNLLAKTRALDEAVANADVLQIIRSALGASIQISILSTMEIFPEETSQALHQDDAYFRLQRPHPAVVMNTMWALTDFTEANGATRLVPGSSHWDRDVDIREPSIAAEMPAGSVLIWDGAVWHGGGPNATDQVRFGLSLNYCRGWVRQQENQYLAVPRELARTLPHELQKLLGYEPCAFLGFVDRSHPMEILNGPRPGKAEAA